MPADDDVAFIPRFSRERQVTEGGSIPGLDEVFLLAVKDATTPCNSLEHRLAGRRAVLVAFCGHFGRRYFDRDVLWPECWGRQYPFCDECWQQVRSVLADRRPGLKILDKPERVAPEGQG